MLLEVCTLAKDFTTLIALERFLTSVNLVVFKEV